MNDRHSAVGQIADYLPGACCWIAARAKRRLSVTARSTRFLSRVSCNMAAV